MALIKCKECNNNVSSDAEQCPHCGYKMTKDTIDDLKNKAEHSTKKISQSNNEEFDGKVGKEKKHIILNGIRYFLAICCFACAYTGRFWIVVSSAYFIAGILILPFTYAILSKKIKIKYKWQILISITVFFIALSVDGINVNNINNENYYYVNAKSFYSEIVENGKNIESVGNDIISNWEDQVFDSKYSSIDDAVQAALNSNSSNIYRIKQNHIKIKDTYSKLLKIPNICDNCSTLKEKIDDIYSFYNNFYILVTSPTGSYIEFKNRFNNVDLELTNTLTQFKLVLESHH